MPLSREATLVVVDDLDRFRAHLRDGDVPGHTEPAASLGARIGAGMGGADLPAGRVLVTTRGIGLADVALADAGAREADGRWSGARLDRR